MKDKAKKKTERKQRVKLRLPGQFYTVTFKIVSYVAVLMIITLTIALSLMAMLYYGGVFGNGQQQPPVSPVLLVILLVLVSAIIGCVLAVALYSLTFREFTQFEQAMNRVAKGDFSVTLPVSDESYMHDLNNAFNAMVRSLQSIETLKTDFISDFSHEFKTPITSICGFAKLLKNPNVAEEDKQEYINIIISESTRLSQLAQNTLSMSKLDNSDGAIERRVYSLDEQLRHCAIIFQAETERRHIDISVIGDDAEYYGNEELMQQMWINLIGNAVKFTPEGGSIDIAVKGGDPVTVSVRDTGCGMDEETKAHIFDKFYQGDKSRSSAGNGLGLAIVRKIVQLAGGGIDVVSAPGQGSTFTVTLPDLRADGRDKPRKKDRERAGSA